MDRAAFAYASCYCEENIWQLCPDPRVPDTTRHVALISNPERCVALWMQRAAPPRQPVLWDYHVIMIARPGGDGAPWRVWDLDTRLTLPCDLEAYVRQTFLPLRSDYQHLAPRFRVIDADDYRRDFSSDRSHMRAPDGGGWQQPPPPWPPICREDTPSFMGWTDMLDDDDGSLDLPGLLRRFDNFSSR